jgi:hypothetical protein
MAFRKVNLAGGNRVVTMDFSISGLASAAVSGIQIGSWPFDAPGKLVALTHVADAISVSGAGSVLIRYRRYDASAASAAFLVNAGKTILADTPTRICASDANGVEAQQDFDIDDRLLVDKNAGGSLTRPVFRGFFAMG